MSKFLIANKLRRGSPLVTPSGIGQEIAEQYHVESALNAVQSFFDASVASEIYWQGKQDYYSLDSDFGPLNPPYENLWMEWTIPARVLVGGNWREVEQTTWAANVTTKPLEISDFDEWSIRKWFDMMRPKGLIKKEPTDDEYKEIAELVQARGLDSFAPAGVGNLVVSIDLFFSSHTAENVFLIPVRKTIQLNPKTGSYVAGSCFDLSPESATESQRSYLHGIVDANPVWLALQLINCRNVKTALQGSVFNRSSAEKRRGEPVIKYHTIVLPGTKTEARIGKRQPKQDVLALHKVRGHFKTFTAERPLMGRHVGTYWWGWQVRGNPDNGIVISDYKLKINGAA
jgi:hypothetical protein